MDAVGLCLLTPEAYAMVPVYQILSFRFLDHDLELSTEYFDYLASKISPIDLFLVKNEYNSDPSILEKSFKVALPPLNYKQWLQSLTVSVEKTDVASGSASFAEKVKANVKDSLPSGTYNTKILSKSVVSLPSIITNDIILHDTRKIKKHNSTKTKDETNTADLYVEATKQPNFKFGVEAGQYSFREGTKFPPRKEVSKMFVNKQFDCVIYAPPGSGKSEFIREFDAEGEVYDTDYLPYWNRINPKFVVTNDPSFLRCGKIAYMILPSRTVFEDRCRARKLDVKKSWYNDVLDYTSDAQVIRTEEYLSVACKGLRLTPSPLMARIEAHL